MQPFADFCGLVVPIDSSNIDTDAIIPKQFLKATTRLGFGQFLFDEKRYLDRGVYGMDCSKRPINSEFALNQDRYQNAEILLTRENFGCGSSREHAVWALMDYGFKTVIASSFANIFRRNAIINGLLPIELPNATISSLFQECEDNSGYSLGIHLDAQEIATPSGIRHAFSIDAYSKEQLLLGLDEIALTLRHADEITAFEKRYQQIAPWVFTPINLNSDHSNE